MRLTVLSMVFAAVFGAMAWSQGGSLKSRATAPKPADLDANVSISALLQKSGPQDWSTNKAATVEGYIVQVEKDPDGDVVVFLADNPGETSTTKWMIAEVPPAWQKKDANLSEHNLRALFGKQAKLTGWLFYDPDDQDPRGTRWELHPVTQISH